MGMGRQVRSDEARVTRPKQVPRGFQPEFNPSVTRWI